MHAKHTTDSLADLARSNQQTRDAALLRATTDLFVRDLRHDRDQIRRFEELATHFLPKVAVADRVYVADRLAVCSDAPQAVVRMLARDVIDVAAPVIRRSSVLEPFDLLAVIASTGVEHHRLIACRPALADRVKRALRLTGDADVLTQLDGRVPAPNSGEVETGPKSVLPVASVMPLRPTAPSGREHDPAYFLGLDRPQRLRMLADFATRPPARRRTGSADRLDRAFRSILGAAKIVGYARGGQTDALIAAIAEGLDIDAGFVAASLRDGTGEPLAILLKALHLDDTQAQQVFLLTTPAGRDTATFFPLADVYAGMEVGVAETICDLWRAYGSARPAGHQPYVAADDERRRSAASETQAQKSASTREQSKRA